ncbi:MAG: MFS transporter, partial [Pseudomonadota bacterium]
MQRQTMPAKPYWLITLIAAAVLMITMGARQSMGLFVSPLNTTTGLGIAAISFSLAVGQFTWGAMQPIAGAIADRYGPGRVIASGAIILSLGYAITPLMTSGIGMTFAIGFLMAAGAGAGSFSVLIGAAAQRVPVEKRGMASGIINAGGSFLGLCSPFSCVFLSFFGGLGASSRSGLGGLSTLLHES